MYACSAWSFAALRISAAGSRFCTPLALTPAKRLNLATGVAGADHNNVVILTELHTSTLCSRGASYQGTPSGVP